MYAAICSDRKSGDEEITDSSGRTFIYDKSLLEIGAIQTEYQYLLNAVRAASI